MSDFSKIPNLTLGTDPNPYRKRIAELEQQLANADENNLLIQSDNLDLTNQLIAKGKRIAELEREVAEARKDAERLREKLQEIRDWPPEDYPRRDADGYPKEYMYDEFAYRRMIDSYRHAIDNAMKGQDDDRQ